LGIQQKDYKAKMPIFKHRGIFYISVSYNGKRVRKTAGKNATRNQARALEKKLQDDLFKIKLGQKPERDLMEALLRWLDGECQTLKSPRKFESHARALLPFVKGKRLIDAPQAAEDAKVVMRDTGLSPATINRRIALLRRIANLAYSSWGWLDQPIGLRIRLLPERNERHYYLTPPQVEAVAAACPNPEAGDMVRLAALTGLRRSELFKLSQDNIRDGVILLDASGKGRPRAVPYPKEAESIVLRLPLILSDAQLRKSWDKARHATGLHHIRFHDLRHTYASWLVQSGVPLRAVQDLLGHATLSMTQRYSHLSADFLQTAVQTMSASLNRVK
jgi:integrase